MNESEARRIMANGLGRAQLEFATSVCAPLYWIVREEDGKLSVNNGTAFFLDTGSATFAVTADHVLRGLAQDQQNRDVISVQMGHDLVLEFDTEHEIIDRDSDIDIATFRIAKQDVDRLGKTILTGIQSNWPPSAPQQGKGIYFSGFPGQERMWLSPSEISFGAAPGGGVADSVSERTISTLFDRSRWIDVMGKGFPPENYDFGGISGGPMLSAIERRGLRSWALAGVIVQGPSVSSSVSESISGLEIVQARRAHFIGPKGEIDRTRW